MEEQGKRGTSAVTLQPSFRSLTRFVPKNYASGRSWQPGQPRADSDQPRWNLAHSQQGQSGKRAVDRNSRLNLMERRNEGYMKQTAHRLAAAPVLQYVVFRFASSWFSFHVIFDIGDCCDMAQC